MDKIPYNKPIKYKELIGVFNLEYKEGGARTTQLKKLFREYNIKKCGTYYIVEEELTQLEKLLVKTKPKFKDYIIPLVYSYMHNGIYDDEIVKSKGNILKDLAMINDNFYAVREDPYKYALMIDDNLDGDDLLRYTEECDVEDCGDNDLELSMENIIYYGTFEDLCMMEMEIWG